MRILAKIVTSSSSFGSSITLKPFSYQMILKQNLALRSPFYQSFYTDVKTSRKKMKRKPLVVPQAFFLNVNINSKITRYVERNNILKEKYLTK